MTLTGVVSCEMGFGDVTGVAVWLLLITNSDPGGGADIFPGG